MGIVYLEDGRLADQFQIGAEPYVLSDALVMRVMFRFMVGASWGWVRGGSS
jgi:hypothetical protein